MPFWRLFTVEHYVKKKQDTKYYIQLVIYVICFLDDFFLFSFFT